MKLFKKMKDGGPESTVTGYWLVEIKGLFSIVLMDFSGASRPAYHTHAFDCWSWLLSGELSEEIIEVEGTDIKSFRFKNYKPSWKPFFTGRDRFHKVSSKTPHSWVLSFRGPWASTWKEFLPSEGRFRTLTHGRKEVQ